MFLNNLKGILIFIGVILTLSNSVAFSIYNTMNKNPEKLERNLMLIIFYWCIVVIMI